MEASKFSSKTIVVPIGGGSAPEYFVAHEFSSEQMDDLRKAIQDALEGFGLAAYYADGELRQGHIFKDKILPKIREGIFGIYDISNTAKPNVFLELGAGLALEKPCVIICKVGTPIPADLGGLDRIEYTSYKHLTQQLSDKLQHYASASPREIHIIVQGANSVASD